MPDIILQGSPTDGGALCYIGKSRCGKTTKAVDDMNRDSRKTGFPKVVLDLGAAQSFRHLPHAKDVNEVLTDLFVHRVDAKIWTPREEERALFWTKLHQWGGVHVMADEVWNICSPTYVDEGFVTASNQYAHGVNGSIYFYYTAQRIIYINPKLYPAVQKWFIFKPAKGAEQDILRKLFGELPETGQARKRGECATYDEAFTDEDAPAEGGKRNGADVPDKRPGSGLPPSIDRGEVGNHPRRDDPQPEPPNQPAT